MPPEPPTGRPPSSPSEASRPETTLVTRGRPRGEGAPLNHPIGASSTFRAGGGRRYARDGTEGAEALEEVVGALEGGEAVAFASGMAAVAAVLDLVPVGGTVVASRLLYVGTVRLLTRAEEAGRFQVRRLTPVELESGDGAAADLVLLEDPSNPTLARLDVGAVASAWDGALVAVDNTIATPLGARPLASGAGVSLHSATKYLGGHSDLLLGVVVASHPSVAERLRSHRILTGAVPGSLETFLALRGIRTLAVRMERCGASAAELARRLARRPEVSSAHHPGVGSLLAVELAGGAEAADRFVEGLGLWVHATSLGGVESTLERRARWADEGPAVPPGLVRMSVGLEHVDDLWADIAQALDGLY